MESALQMGPKTAKVYEGSDVVDSRSRSDSLLCRVLKSRCCLYSPFPSISLLFESAGSTYDPLPGTV